MLSSIMFVESQIKFGDKYFCEISSKDSASFSCWWMESASVWFAVLAVLLLTIQDKDKTVKYVNDLNVSNFLSHTVS